MNLQVWILCQHQRRSPPLWTRVLSGTALWPVVTSAGDNPLGRCAPLSLNCGSSHGPHWAQTARFRKNGPNGEKSTQAHNRQNKIHSLKIICIMLKASVFWNNCQCIFAKRLNEGTSHEYVLEYSSWKFFKKDKLFFRLVLLWLLLFITE